MGRMVRKQVYLGSRQDDLLKEESARSGMTESEVIREALDVALDRVAERRRLESLWDEWDESADAVSEALAESGGVGKWSREEAHDRKSGSK